MRRYERLLNLAKRLFDTPHLTVSLSELAEEWFAAKSSLSEDVSLIRSVLENNHQGSIETLAGAGGGVRYVVGVPPVHRDQFLAKISAQLMDITRVLPDGFVYMSDILGDPDVLDMIGRLMAEKFISQNVNVVVTIETKGIPLAIATARYLHVPVVIVRREHKLTEGAALSMHYVSGSERRIQTMSISKRALPLHAKALIVDDFMRAGATAEAVHRLLAEFSVEVIGTAVFVATVEPTKKRIQDYFALLSMMNDGDGKNIYVQPAIY